MTPTTPRGEDTATGTDPEAKYREPGYHDKSFGQAVREDLEFATELLAESEGDFDEAAKRYREEATGAPALARQRADRVDEKVVRNTGEHRWELRLDDQVVAAAYFERHPDHLTVTRSEVRSDLEGQGLGSILVRGLLEDVRAEGASIDVDCPFVREYLRRHPDRADVVRSGQPTDPSGSTERLVVGHVIGVEPTRDAMEELRRGEFELVRTRSPRSTAVPRPQADGRDPEDEGEAGPRDVKTVMRTAIIGAVVGVIVGALVGVAFAGVLSARNPDLGIGTLLLASGFGFAVTGAGLGVLFGRGFELAKEDEERPRRLPADGHTDIVVRARDDREEDEIASILGRYGETRSVPRPVSS